MNEPDKLVQKRDAIIERIKQVFPKKPKLMGKKATFEITRSDYDPEASELKAVFNGKLWEELVDYPGITVYLSDIDYAGLINDKIYLYYLPTLLVASLKENFARIIYSHPYERIHKLLSRFTLEQLETLIDYFEFQTHYVFAENDGFADQVEDILLRLMMRRNEMAKEQAK